MNSIPQRIVATAALILIIVTVFAAVRLNRDKREARQLILDAANLAQSDGPGSLSYFLAKHRKFMHAIGDCNNERCAYVADLRNAPLLFFRLAPPGEFYISVIKDKGYVDEVYISVKTVIAGKQYAATIRNVGVTRCSDGCETFSSDAVVDTSGKTMLSAIELGPRATVSDRRIAFQIDADCIFEMNGCNNPLQVTHGWPIR